MFFKLKIFILLTIIVLITILVFSINCFAQQNENNNLIDMLEFWGVGVIYNNITINHLNVTYNPTANNFQLSINCYVYTKITNNFFITSLFSGSFCSKDYKYWDFTTSDGSNIEEEMQIFYWSFGIAFDFPIGSKLNIRPAIQYKWTVFIGDTDYIIPIIGDVQIPMIDVNIMFIIHAFPKSKKSLQYQCFNIGFSIFIPGIFKTFPSNSFYENNEIKSYILIYFTYYFLSDLIES